MPLTKEEGDQLKASISDAVAEGLRKALEDPEFWAAAADGMQRRATLATGSWMMAMFKATLSKAFWALLILMGVYSFGGWPALTKLFVILTGK